MSTVITRVEIRNEKDILYVRQRARLIAELLGFDRQDQTRISTAVSQILRNFISNAFKFTARGEIRVAAKLTANGQAVRFSVTDTGVGIAPENQHRLFQETLMKRNESNSKLVHLLSCQKGPPRAKRYWNNLARPCARRQNFKPKRPRPFVLNRFHLCLILRQNAS
jgi:anti-sigma regulatory factor (Ser/Thr protein kinase)